MIDINVDLFQWFIMFFNTKSAQLAGKSTSGSGIRNENISNKELAEELYKPIIIKI